LNQRNINIIIAQGSIRIIDENSFETS